MFQGVQKKRNNNNNFRKPLLLLITTVCPLSSFVLNSFSISSISTTALHEHYKVKVHFEGTSCNIVASTEETLLNALERSDVVATKLALAYPPNECRRGNCMTCAVKHLLGSKSNNLKSKSSTFLADEVQNEGFVLACSSYVRGEGVEIELGHSNSVWHKVYQERFRNEEAERIGREACAKMMREYDLANPEKWQEKNEKYFD